MTTTTTPSATTTYQVGMGQIVLVRGADVAKTVLGSCIGLVLYHRRRQIGAIGHIVLPESAGRNGAAGKYADKAIPAMLEMLRLEDIHPSSLIAKMAGGSNMFGSNGPLQIGDANIAAVKTLLKETQVATLGECVGGSSGRRLVFDCQTGEVTIHMAKQPTNIL